MRLAEQLGLHRPELRAWASYDWGISAFQVAVTTALFPIYWAKVIATDLGPSAATGLLGYTAAGASILVAIIAPVLGTIADERGSKKRFLAAFLTLGIGATAGLWFVGAGDVLFGAIMYTLATVGATGSFVFYEALLPHIARGEEIDRVSTAGYALGYIGGGILLVLQLMVIQGVIPLGIADTGLLTRIAFLMTAVWWAIFSVPLFRGVSEPPAMGGHDTPIRFGPIARRLVGTFRDLRGYPQALMLLAAFFVYNDGIQTIIRFAVILGDERQIPQQTLIAAIVLVQFVGVPCAFGFGWLAGIIGAKRAVLIGIAVYAVIAVVARNVSTGGQFLMLAGMVALVQGGTQGLSRSLFARLTPASRSGEFFGLYSVFEKFSGVFGPLAFPLSIALTGSARNGVLILIGFFVVGFVLLLRVDVASGERQIQLER
ncbi:MAG: MFS transporter [Gemmatimonadales bacterium]|nr:MFS transporter [Gemmatimonadales bacterium]